MNFLEVQLSFPNQKYELWTTTKKLILDFQIHEETSLMYLDFILKKSFIFALDFIFKSPKLLHKLLTPRGLHWIIHMYEWYEWRCQQNVLEHPNHAQPNLWLNKWSKWLQWSKWSKNGQWTYHPYLNFASSIWCKQCY